MKKLKKLFIIIMLFSISLIFTACDLQSIENFLLGNRTENYSAQSIEHLNSSETLSLLLETRDKIRGFNVFIETVSYNLLGNIMVNESTNVGSGIIIAKALDFKTYYVLTNHHVIKTEDGYAYVKYNIETINHKTNSIPYTAKLVYQDSINDMAVLSFTSSEDLTIANLTQRLNETLKKDEFLLSVGNPSGVKNVVTYGKYKGVSNISNVNFTVIYHTVLINPGNSGGALTDINGNVVGINTWGTKGDDKDNYAIPLTQIKIFLTKVQQNVMNFPQVM